MAPPRRFVDTRRANPICVAESTFQVITLVFTYHVVPKGVSETNALVRGALYTATVERAVEYLCSLGLSDPAVNGRQGLEVILKDREGAELWRGPFSGSR